MPKVFVYGAQMIHPESLGAAWPAKLEDHAVRFVARGLPIFEPVFAGLEAAAGETAYGVVVEFSDATWAALVRHEVGYQIVEVEAELLEADHTRELGTATLVCFAFHLRSRQRTKSEGRPSARYARKLAAGARAHGLPREVIERYEQAAARGGRASLALAWLFPIASRIGLVQTAMVVAVVVLGAVVGLAWMLRSG